MEGRLDWTVGLIGAVVLLEGWSDSRGALIGGRV